MLRKMAESHEGVVPNGTEEDQDSELKESLDQLSSSRRELLKQVSDFLGDEAATTGILNDLPLITVQMEDLVAVCEKLKTEPNLDFKMLLCMSCVDYLEYFQMVYFVHSLQHEQTLVVKVNTSYENPSVPSVTGIWKAANWYEREAHDLFGVKFADHPDLSPILLYDEFEGYPGRKEFPFHDYQEF